MKKVVLNISDMDYEKFRYEAIVERKTIAEVIKERIFHKPFQKDVEQAYDEWASTQIHSLLKEES